MSSIQFTDNLLLLMGTNPLPNYVAARLLGEAKTELHLVTTPEMKAMEVPQRLLKLLGRDPSEQNQYIPINAIAPDDIFKKIYERVVDTPGSWGLHYTGGKKIIATHAYRAMEHALADTEREGQGVFSYLDADTLEMVIEQGDGSVQYHSSRLDLPVMLWQLLYLHGKPQSTVTKARWDNYPAGAFSNRPLGQKPHRVPFQPELCEQLKNACCRDDTSTFEKFQQQIPDLSRNTGQTEKDLKEWVRKNFWLEHYVLDQILKIQNECGIDDYALGFESEIFGGEKNFESDILVMQNYRLFYITITTAKREKDNKLKLFEAYIRAQQLGGEQAQVALVTLSPDVDARKMENELRSNLHLTGKVFARDYICDSTNFREYLKDWFQWSA